MLSQEYIDALNKLEKKLNKKICCQDCVEIAATCADGEVPVWNSATSSWICGEGGGEGVSSISVSGETELTGDVTLSEGEGITLTQVANDIEIASHAPVTLNADTPTQDALNLSGQEIQVNPAGTSTYGVVRLSDVVPTVVANYSALPAANTVSGKFYWASASEGTKFIGALWGGTYYPAGLFYSNGVSWIYMDTPAQATQPQVDAGIVTNQWVAPSTLAASSQWATKNDAIQFKDEGSNLGAAGTVDTIDFVGSAVSAARVGDVLTVTVTGSSPAVISPSQITADQDNYNPTGFLTSTMVRLDFDTGGRAITGFAAGSDGQRITLSNISGNFGYYPGGHPDSSSGNRFLHGKDFIHYPYTNIDIIYDSTSGGWRIIGEENTEGKTGLFYTYSAANSNTGDNPYLGSAQIGTGTLANTASTTTLPAATTLGISAGAGSGYMAYFADAANTFSAFASAHQYVEAIVSIPTLSNATDRFTVEIQFAPTPTSTTLEVNNTIAIRYQDDINSGEWELFTQDNAGSETPIDLNVAVAINTLYKVGLWIDKAKSEARAYINDAYVGRVTGTMPNSVANGARVIIIRTSGNTNARTVNVHSFSAGAIY